MAGRRRLQDAWPKRERSAVLLPWEKKFMPKKAAKMHRLPCLVVPLLALMMSACVMQQPMYRFRAASVSRISYDPKNCVEMPDGRFKCKDVVFTVQSIEPVKAH
jgi:hypothetical protein